LQEASAACGGFYGFLPPLIGLSAPFAPDIKA